ncbi:MAG: hypothetical protein C0412_21015 [Flavobacterium sp.]|nr:hypothetical protein [Flavobacterium sp.]
MKKEFNKENWTIDKLVKNINIIDFPEFQREPSIWRLDKKQRLIDSIIRGFDISSIYFYKRDDGKYDCIDGQQRINAIWSYIGINETDRDNAFHTRIENELYSDKDNIKEVDQTRYDDLPEKWQKEIKNYELNIVFITKIDEEDELNLQFLRLQLGAPLRGGEKLNAMQGDMRDLLFIGKDKNKFINMDYFLHSGIRKGRFGIQEVAAQILLNAFSKKETGEFHRSRYIDLQEFFKQKMNFLSSDKKIIEEIKRNLEIISKHFKKDNLGIINNKALAVSVYLFVSDLIELKREKDINQFVEFLIKFLKTKEWQMSKGLDMARAYRDILNFQTSLTQAAGEKPAIEKRHDFWKDYFDYYKKKKGLIKGDEEYKKAERKNPDEERDK